MAQKTYSIVINGVQESIDAVSSLNKQLEALESRIQNLSSKSVKVGSSSGGGSLSEEEAVQREINKLKKEGQTLDAKIVAAQDEIYKKVDATKQLYKETIADQKAIAAQERLAADTYSNTMQGMKQQLADLKAVINTTDIGDSDRIKAMTEQAKELTTKLKEMEEAYGQFGRNVGNYASAAEGFNKIKVAVGDTVREYDNYKQALKSLKQERFELSQTIGTEAEAYKEVDVALRQLESSYKDLESSSASMDKMLDTMQSIMAIASVGQGIGALFGLDNSKIQESIQKLVALQNVLQGVETIRKQWLSGEFFGGIFTKANAAIDKFSASLLGANKSMKTAAKAEKEVVVGNVAIGTSAAGATLAVKALSFALKTIGVGIILTVVAAAFEGLQYIIEKLVETSDKAAEATSKINDKIADAAVNINKTIAEISVFNGSLKEEKDLVDKLNKEWGTTFGNYKTLAEWLDILKQKREEYIESMRLQAEAEVLLEKYKEEYKKYIEEVDRIQKELTDPSWTTIIGNFMYFRTETEKNTKAILEEAGAWNKAQHALNMYTLAIEKLFNYRASHNLSQSGTTSGTTSTVKSTGASVGKTVKQVEADIAKMRVDAMKQGFSKTILELQLERDRRIAEAKKTGKLVAQQIEQINANYNQKVFDARLKLHQELLQEERRYADELLKIQQETRDRYFEISNSNNQRRRTEAINNFPYSARTMPERNETYIDSFTWDYNFVIDRKVIAEYKKLEDELSLIDDIMNRIKNNEAEIVNGKDLYEWRKEWARVYEEIIQLENKYVGIAEASSRIIGRSDSDAFAIRLSARQQYYDAVLKAEREYSKKEIELERQRLGLELKEQQDAEEKRHKLITGGIYDAMRIGENEIGEKPRSLYLKYLDSIESGELAGKDDDALSKIFEKDREEMDKWLNDLKNKLKEGEITWDEYIEITESSLIKSYIQAKTDYEQFLGEYNKMPKDKQKENEDKLNELRTLANNRYVNYLHKLEEELQTHGNAMLTITNQGNARLQDAEQAYREAMQKANSEYFSNIETEYEKAISSISTKIDKSTRYNSWGFVNIGSARKQLKELEKEVDIISLQITASMESIRKAFENKEISAEQYDALVARLSALNIQLGDVFNNIKNKAQAALDDFVQNINRYLQTALQGFQEIMQAFDDLEEYNFDKEQEALDKMNEMLADKLSEQEDIISEHKNNVNSIEDELSNARGDRRQHLIDQLNEEIRAQREAEKERQQIEKQQAAAEKKQEELDKKRKQAEYDRNLRSILISTAMATANGLATQPFVPVGIAMGSLATALGMVQYALAKKQKPYANGGQLDGGVAVGNRHRDGGIKVLGGRAEIEGGEFITNRLTTSKNIDLLEFVNSKKKRVDLSDMIDFYNGGTVKKTINKTRSKFADGGALPTLPSQLDIQDQLKDIVLVQSQQPIYVTVKDIEDRMNAVNKVRVLSGMENK